MSTEENKQLILRWKEKRNKGNANVADELCVADRVLCMSGLPFPGPVRGREPFKQLFAARAARSLPSACAARRPAAARRSPSRARPSVTRLTRTLANGARH